jgi:polysaccharide deacetylase family protein (PEP-CTERM system associated)
MMKEILGVRFTVRRPDTKPGRSELLASATRLAGRRLPTDNRLFLLGIDLEDVRTMIPGGERFIERVPPMIDRFLAFLERHDARCTFFTVGNVARRYPDLVRKVLDRGHEVGCHSSEHTTLDRHDPGSFRADLERCLQDLTRAGAQQIRGFRAPMGSLVPKTAWAYEVLPEFGFTYSSSVLPARNPRYGWPGFPPEGVRIRTGIVEIPVSVTGMPALNVPFAGGVYFRLLPRSIVRHFFERHRSAGLPVVGYLHPFDVDTEQERFMHPKLNGSRFLNRLMYYNRSEVLPRLATLLADEWTVIPYAEYVESISPG